MDIGSVVNQGLIGLQNSQASIAQSAQQIAHAGTLQQSTSPESNQVNDLVEPLVNLKIQTQVFDSSAKVIKTADEAIGTLLDIKA